MGSGSGSGPATSLSGAFLYGAGEGRWEPAGAQARRTGESHTHATGGGGRGGRTTTAPSARCSVFLSSTKKWRASSSADGGRRAAGPRARSPRRRTPHAGPRRFSTVAPRCTPSSVRCHLIHHLSWPVTDSVLLPPEQRNSPPPGGGTNSSFRLLGLSRSSLELAASARKEELVPPRWGHPPKTCQTKWYPPCRKLGCGVLGCVVPPSCSRNAASLHSEAGRARGDPNDQLSNPPLGAPTTRIPPPQPLMAPPDHVDPLQGQGLQRRGYSGV